MRLGLLCGSFSSSSSNQAALNVIEARAQEQAEISPVWIGGLSGIPAFVPQQVDSPPAAVADFRSQITAADAIVIAAPEYAAGLAGSTKNALDWLVGASSLYQKPVAVISAGTTGGQRTIEQLVHTLSWQGAWTFATLGIEAPRTKMTDETFTDPETVAALTHVLDQLIAAVSGTGPERRAVLGRVVGRFSIDIERFGDVT